MFQSICNCIYQQHARSDLWKILNTFQQLDPIAILDLMLQLTLVSIVNKAANRRDSVGPSPDTTERAGINRGIIYAVNRDFIQCDKNGTIHILMKKRKTGEPLIWLALAGCSITAINLQWFIRLYLAPRLEKAVIHELEAISKWGTAAHSSAQPGTIIGTPTSTLVHYLLMCSVFW